MIPLPFTATPFVDAADVRDVDDLAAVHADAFQRTWSAHDFTAMLTDPSIFALAVRLRSWFGPRRLVGFVLVRFAADEAEILTIATGSRHRRRGYGRMLMDDVIRRLYREHIATLFLEVERGNAAAVSLYRSLGFEVAGERKNYYASPEAGDATALVMRLQVR
jgi:[ribosomal protein S18]-alanine N-acetyltransferase